MQWPDHERVAEGKCLEAGRCGGRLSVGLPGDSSVAGILFTNAVERFLSGDETLLGLRAGGEHAGRDS